MPIAKKRRSRKQPVLLRFAKPGVFYALALFVILLAFAAGYGGQRMWSHGPRDAATATADAAVRAQALGLLDEAVRARWEERFQGALNAARQARALDEALPGVDALVGELALEQKDTGTVRRAANEALRRGHNQASAHLLLAVVLWMNRNVEDPAKAGPAAMQALGEAAVQEPSNAAVYFFLGELSRLRGESEMAHRHLLGALHRQAPWISAGLLAVKLHLAAEEAAEVGRPVLAVAESRPARAALALRVAGRSEIEAREVLEEFFAVTPAAYARVLADDPAVAGYLGSPEFEAGLQSTVVEVPFGEKMRDHSPGAL
jgi:hypothetical protein